MGFMKNIFAALEQEITKSLNEGDETSTKTSNRPPTRWERAVVALDSIIVQVTKVDPDGVDLVCFGGDDDPDWYRNIKNTKGVEAMVNDKQPTGVSKILQQWIRRKLLF